MPPRGREMWTFIPSGTDWAVCGASSRLFRRSRRPFGPRTNPTSLRRATILTASPRRLAAPRGGRKRSEPTVTSAGRRVRTGRTATGTFTLKPDAEAHIIDTFTLSPNPCWFHCRKNPVHFQECSHPGDTDYEEQQEEEEEGEDRPECPYGTDCYRSDTRSRTPGALWEG